VSKLFQNSDLLYGAGPAEPY